MFGITGFKLIIILIAGLILVGPEKMPEIARTIGKGMRMFNAAKDDMERMLKADMFAAENPGSIFAEKSTKDASSGTVASTLYDNDDDEEEEEE